MSLQGSIKGDGLGLLAWWAADEEEGEEAAEQEQQHCVALGRTSCSLQNQPGSMCSVGQIPRRNYVCM